MKTVLVLSPHFPPVDTPDMHRARISVRHFPALGWRPIVLAVHPDHVSGIVEPALLAALPDDLEVERSAAVPLALTSAFGLRDVGLRAYACLFARGCRILKRTRVDLIYVTSTVFHAFSLAALWKRLFAVPFVLDLQDPWGNWLPEPAQPRAGLKRRVSRFIHRHMESRVVPMADGFVSVSRAYLDEIDARYPECADKPHLSLPFGFSSHDTEIICDEAHPHEFFDPSDGLIHGVYLGRAGADFERALTIVFTALARGMRRHPRVFSRVRLHFIGTDYAPGARARSSVAPVAARCGVGHAVSEHPGRVSYARALGLLRRAGFLVIPGSDDPRYTASKIFPYILARKPIVSVLHRDSSAAGILASSGSTAPTTFDGRGSDDACVSDLLQKWHTMLARPTALPMLDEALVAAHSSLSTSRAQCDLFDRVLAARRAPREALGRSA